MSIDRSIILIAYASPTGRSKTGPSKLEKLKGTNLRFKGFGWLALFYLDVGW